MLDEQAKKTMLLHIPHALNICGVKDGDNLNGFTVSWVTQSSFKPPMIVACVKQDSGSNAMIKNSGVFAISFLEDTQKDLAAKFFKPQSRVGDKLADLDFTVGAETGCPIITDSLGYVECKVVGTVDDGDHTIFVGEVIGAGMHKEGNPLLLSGTGWQYGG